MKRIVCSALLFLLMAAPQLRAQNIDLGIKGGVNIANISTNISEFGDNQSKTGFVGGVYSSFRFGSGTFALQPEILYSQKGFKTEILSIDNKLKVNYIEVPVLFKANIRAGDVVRPALYAGPVFSFETGCDFQVGDLPSVDCDTGDALSRNKTDIGIDFGGNLDFMLGSVVLVLDVRYQLGLTNLNDDEEFPEESYKTRAWQIMAGFGFPLGG